jgi:hypothetical protein
MIIIFGASVVETSDVLLLIMFFPQEIKNVEKTIAKADLKNNGFILRGSFRLQKLKIEAVAKPFPSKNRDTI